MFRLTLEVPYCGLSVFGKPMAALPTPAPVASTVAEFGHADVRTQDAERVEILLRPPKIFRRGISRGSACRYKVPRIGPFLHLPLQTPRIPLHPSAHEPRVLTLEAHPHVLSDDPLFRSTDLPKRVRPHVIPVSYPAK